MTRHRRLMKTMRNPGRAHHRRRYRPPAERPQAYKARLLPRAALDALWGKLT
jgi:hypothetical protein